MTTLMTEEEKKASKKEANRRYREKNPAVHKKSCKKWYQNHGKDAARKRRQIYDDYIAGKLKYVE